MLLSIDGMRRENMRAEIDTSPPFGSVKEAVTRFGGSGPSIPLYKLGEPFNNFEDFDIKKVEEQAAELEKDLIVKELETLDVLEELGATKRIVEDLKQQLQKEALKFTTPDVNSCEQVVGLGTPVIKEIYKENDRNDVHNQQEILQNPSCCSMSSPDMILMELQQAKVNLGKTLNELRVVQSSVESLYTKMKNEKMVLQRTHENLASNFEAVSAQEQARLNPPASHVESKSYNPANMKNCNCDFVQYNRMVETRRSQVSNPLPMYEEHAFNVKAAAEMRWFAAKKMEEAARAAEAIALAEIKAFSSAERACEFAQPEPEKFTFALPGCSPLNSKPQIPEESTLKKVIDSKFQIDETNISRLTILKKLEEASEEVLHSKQVLTDALNRIEKANRKHHAAKEALLKWIPEDDAKTKGVYNSSNCNKFNRAVVCQDIPLPDVTMSTTANNNAIRKPVWRPTISMRDVLSRKEVPEGYVTRKEMEDHTERQKVALSQMLRVLREDLTLPPKAEKDESDQKQFMAQRKKFGFIQISLPLSRLNKKRA